MTDFWLLVGLVGMTMIVTTGKVFDGLRKYLVGFKRRVNPLRILGDMISCSMCTGFWVGFLWKLVMLDGKVVDAVVAGGVVSLTSYVADLAVGFIEALAGKERG